MVEFQHSIRLLQNKNTCFADGSLNSEPNMGSSNALKKSFGHLKNECLVTVGGVLVITQAPVESLFAEEAAKRLLT